MDRCHRPIAALLFAGLVAFGAGAHAEMCAGEYQTGSRRMTRAQRAQEQARIDAERERAEQSELERRLQEEVARQEEARRRAARPPGVQLVEYRCGPCHSPDFVARHAFGRVGWWVTVLRMEWFNGARLAAAERPVIVAHLVETQPAGAARAALEWSLAGLAVSLPAVAWVALRRRRRHRPTATDAARSASRSA